MTTRLPASAARAHCMLLSCGLLLALSGCASSPAGHASPAAAVDLSGEWVLDPNLSDDPESVAALEKALAAGKATPASLKSGEKPEAAGSPPQRLTIRQSGNQLSIQIDGADTPQAYTAGGQSTCPDGDCRAVWRGALFVIDSRPTKGRPLEQIYALDGEGHLIVTNQTGKLDVKLVYGHPRG